MPEIVIQAEIAGMTIAFTNLIEGEQEKIHAYLDRCTIALNRERAKDELLGVLTDLVARRETVARAGEHRMGLRKKRADERARMMASFEAAHQIAAKRADFALNQQQKAGLAAFDAETVEALRKLDGHIEQARDEIPLFWKKLTRLEKIVAGEMDRSGVLYEAMRGPLAEAAD